MLVAAELREQPLGLLDAAGDGLGPGPRRGPRCARLRRAGRLSRADRARSGTVEHGTGDADRAVVGAGAPQPAPARGPAVGVPSRLVSAPLKASSAWRGGTPPRLELAELEPQVGPVGSDRERLLEILSGLVTSADRAGPGLRGGADQLRRPRRGRHRPVGDGGQPRRGGRIRRTLGGEQRRAPSAGAASGGEARRSPRRRRRGAARDETRSVPSAVSSRPLRAPPPHWQPRPGRAAGARQVPPGSSGAPRQPRARRIRAHLVGQRYAASRARTLAVWARRPRPRRRVARAVSTASSALPSARSTTRCTSCVGAVARTWRRAPRPGARARAARDPARARASRGSAARARAWSAAGAARQLTPGDQHHHRQRGDSTGRRSRPARGWDVSAVDVLEHEQQRRVARGPAEQRDNRLEQPRRAEDPARPSCAPRRRARNAPGARPPGPPDRLARRRRPAAREAKAAARGSARPTRLSGAAPPRSSAAHGGGPGAGRARPCAQLARQPRLADPRFAADHRRPCRRLPRRRARRARARPARDRGRRSASSPGTSRAASVGRHRRRLEAELVASSLASGCEGATPSSRRRRSASVSVAAHRPGTIAAGVQPPDQPPVRTLVERVMLGLTASQLTASSDLAARSAASGELLRAAR